jgi:hypothetical protein
MKIPKDAGLSTPNGCLIIRAGIVEAARNSHLEQLVAAAEEQSNALFNFTVCSVMEES